MVVIQEGRSVRNEVNCEVSEGAWQIELYEVTFMSTLVSEDNRPSTSCQGNFGFQTGIAHVADRKELRNILRKNQERAC